nr:Arc family DNA-binding protein [Massilia oculi]
MKERLEEAAHKAGRSLNAEVVDRLERSFGADVQPTDDEVEALLIKAVNLLRSKG